MIMVNLMKHTDNREEKNAILPGVLYLVATPIGNLSDLSERAIKTLANVDFIAAEDTRNTAFLLSRLGIKNPLVSYYEHNKREKGSVICDRIQAGEACALVTDAGTPAISDPGEDIVRLCIERGISVTSVPGPCAAVNALILSGLCTARFAFEGFLSANKNERREHLCELKNEKRTLIFYEAPHKLRQTLADMCEHLGGKRRVALCRELTKLNEEILRTDLEGAVEYYADKEPRGEYVLIVEPVRKDQLLADAFYADMTVKEHVEYYISQGLDKKDAMKAAARDRGVSKSDIYNELI